MRTATTKAFHQSSKDSQPYKMGPGSDYVCPSFPAPGSRSNQRPTASSYVQEAEEFKLMISNKLPEGWEKALPTFTPEDKGLATRLHSQTMLNALAGIIPGAQHLQNSKP